MNPILSLYHYPTLRSSGGFAFNDIFAWSDDELEQKHDYIQWFFPLTVPSKAHPSSPYLTIEDLEELHNLPNFKGYRKQQREAYKRMLKFFQLERTWFFGVQPEGEWWNGWERPFWVVPGGMDHNYLRITRIITSLLLFNNKDLAEEFLQGLLDADEAYRRNTGKECFPEEVKYFWIEAFENTDADALIEQEQIEKGLAKSVN